MGTSRAATAQNQHITWQVAHEALSRLARERAAADAEEGRWLLEAQRAAAHVHLGFGSFSEYIERLFGYKPRSTLEKLRVAAALEDLPALGQALSRGELNWSAVRELTRVAVRENEREWLQFARGKTVRQLEEVVAGRHLGDTPDSPSDPSARRHVLRFEVCAETFALFRDALDELQRRTGAGSDDDSALLEMARQVLGGPRDEARANYQISLHVCPDCGNGRQQSRGELVPVDADVTRMAHCDAQHLGTIAEVSVQPANDFEDASEHQRAHVGARASQSIPPARRRAVLVRDQHRCQVPGCRNTRFVDVHHLELRSEGGRHSLDNLICLCSTHHRASHRGHLLLQRGPGGVLHARHADGSEYGKSVQPEALDTCSKVFSALRHLGFREGQIRAAFGQLHGKNSLQVTSFDQLLREVLAQLRPHPRS